MGDGLLRRLDRVLLSRDTAGRAAHLSHLFPTRTENTQRGTIMGTSNIPPPDDARWVQEEVAMNNSVVTSALTSTAIFAAEPDEAGDPQYYTFLEMRAFTADGTEHHLFWPVEGLLPLLPAVTHVFSRVLDIPLARAWDVPDGPEGIDWEQPGLHGEEGFG